MPKVIDPCTTDEQTDEQTTEQTDGQTDVACQNVYTLYKFFDCISIVFYILFRKYILFHIVCVKLFASHKKHLHLSSHMLASSVLKVHQRCLITLCSFYVCFTCGPALELSLITKLIMNQQIQIVPIDTKCKQIMIVKSTVIQNEIRNRFQFRQGIILQQIFPKLICVIFN